MLNKEDSDSEIQICRTHKEVWAYVKSASMPVSRAINTSYFALNVHN